MVQGWSPGRWHWVEWERLGCARRMWHSPCPHRKVTSRGQLICHLFWVKKGVKAAALSKSLALGKLRHRSHSPVLALPQAGGRLRHGRAELDPQPGAAPATSSPCPSV